MINVTDKINKISGKASFFSVIPFLLCITLLCPVIAAAEKIETPESFVSRKRSSYEAGLKALKEEYRRWCLVAGKPIIPVGIEQGQPPDVGRPGGEYTYEIEQVYNTWSTTWTGTNPFSWVDVNGMFSSMGSSSSSTGSSRSSSTGDQCTGKSIAFDTTAPGGPYAGILLNESDQSCKLVGFSYSTSSSVWFNALMSNYQYGPGNGWSGSIVTNARYGETYVKTFSKGTSSVGISFKVVKENRSGLSVLSVNNVYW